MVVQSAISKVFWQLSDSAGHTILLDFLGYVHADGEVVLGDVIMSVEAFNNKLDTLVMLKLIERIENEGTSRRMNCPPERFLHGGVVFIHDLEEDGCEVSQLV